MPEVIISGPAGRIEGKYQPGAGENAPVALFLHPHPEHGGTMNNKVTYAMFDAFRRKGFATLRFNFRGVGRSQGVYDRGEGELADAAAALDWLQSLNPTAASIWVGGFSFGAWIGMQLLMRRPEIDRFVVAAPPANMYDFSFLAPCPSSGLIIHGNRDSLVSLESVNKLTAKLRTQRDIRVTQQVIEGADHFFTDRMPQLIGTMEGYITVSLKQIAEEKKAVEQVGLVRPVGGGAPYDPKTGKGLEAEAEAEPQEG
jgi:alpha/beta superfamily hydrolase